MPGAQTIATVRTTTPLLAGTGSKLTTHFYDRMFTHNLEFKETFNMSNQRNGDQREALFNTIAAYASNIENPPALLPAVEKIAQEHTSFQTKPEQCNIVGERLLATLDEMFSLRQEVLDAWGRVYGVLTDVFTNREAGICNENAGKAGGWGGARDFRIMAKTPHSAPITSFELELVDGSAVAEYRSGRYLGVWLKPGGFPHQEIRRYSLARKPGGKDYRIAVKREGSGQVSNWLHNHVDVGGIVELVTPAGDSFIAVADNILVTLVSAGVGQTSMLTIFDTLAKAGHIAQVNWFHAAENDDAHALADEVKEPGQSLPRFTAHTWYRQPNKADRAKDQFGSEGLMNLNKLEGVLSNPTMQLYLRGPVGFMQFVAKQLVDLGVRREGIRYEYFGLHKVL